MVEYMYDNQLNKFIPTFTNENEESLTNEFEKQNTVQNENRFEKSIGNENEEQIRIELQKKSENELDKLNKPLSPQEQLEVLEHAIPEQIRVSKLRLPKNRKNPAKYPPIMTKFGKAYYDDGYYYVFNENYQKRLQLHRLIYEDYHKVTLLEKTHVHHLDGNSLNNEIFNLQLLIPSEHSKLHQDTLMQRINQSKLTNTSGYFRVCKLKDKRRPNSDLWRYLYYENGKQKAITGKTIPRLKKRVLSKGLPWKKL